MPHGRQIGLQERAGHPQIDKTGHRSSHRLKVLVMQLLCHSLGNAVNDENKIIHLPEPIQAASAGTGEFADDDTSEQVAVLYNKWTAKADYIMRVHGDSMEPQIHDGDRVLVREQPAVDLGETGGERFVKIYRRNYLESANPAYPDVELDEDSHCIGKVIGVLDPSWIVER